MEPRDKVLYAHYRQSDNQCFYIGVGTEERPYEKKGRNSRWNRTVKKHGYYVEILAVNLTQAEAFELEIEMIARCREMFPKTMTNIADGGQAGPAYRGDANPRFCGYKLLFNTFGQCFVICGDSDECGFNRVDVSELKKGKRNFTTSRKLHINGVKVRFTKIKVFDHPDREKCFDECANFIVENNLEMLELSDDEIRGADGDNAQAKGKFGAKVGTFKGVSIGKHRSTGAIIICLGETTMKNYGLSQSEISNCINGKRPHHKNFTWTRTTDEYFLNNLLDTHRDMFLDFSSEFRIREYLDKWELQ